MRVLVGEVEVETWDRGEIDRFASAAPLAKPATYLELYDELNRAAAFVGNDTGPAHLAGIIGVPTSRCSAPPTRRTGNRWARASGCSTLRHWSRSKSSRSKIT